MAKISVKRIVPIYTVVTDKFKKELEEGSATELKMIDNQINATYMQIKQLQSRFGLLKNQSTQSAQEQINRSIVELTERMEQLKTFKQNMLASINDMKNKPLGTEVQTGMIENYVDIEPGVNIKSVFDKCKIIIKDDVVKEVVL